MDVERDQRAGAQARSAHGDENVEKQADRRTGDGRVNGIKKYT